MDDNLTTLAHRLRTAQDRNEQIEPFADRARLAVPSAYAIAHRIHQMRLEDGAIPLGRKIGFTNRGIWDEYDVHQPIWGWMYEHTVIRAVEGEARLAIARFAEPKIEPEVVFHFASAPPRDADAAGVLACCDWVAHGFEIVQSHFPGWKFTVGDTIADGGLHAALVIGRPVPVAELGAHPLDRLAAFGIDLFCRGQRRDTGCGANVLDHPANAIVHLAAVLAELPQALPIAAGEIVTTGTLTAAHAIRPGEIWHTELSGIALPGLRLEVVA